MVEEFFEMAPKLFTSALAFKRFINSLLTLLDKKLENYKHLIALDKENQKLIALNEDN